MFCFEGEFHAREITEPFRKIRRRINDLRENVLYKWLHGYIQPSNISSALINGLLLFQFINTRCIEIGLPSCTKFLWWKLFEHIRAISNSVLRRWRDATVAYINKCLNHMAKERKIIYPEIARDNCSCVSFKEVLCL